MKKIVLFPLLLLFISCRVPREGQVTILHTNDMHSQFVPVPATWVDADPQPLIGGMVALEYAVRQARQNYPASLLLDAGDMTTGTLLSKIEYQGALNGGFVAMMNLLGYDAFTIGNHEFDDGQENLKNLLDLAAFDVISANLLIHDARLAPHAFQIYKVGNIRVGVIGVLLTNLASVTAKKNLDNVVIAEPAATTQRIIDEIDAKTDLIIVLTHQGHDADELLASQLKNADVIVGGHSHTRINTAREVNDILIVQAGSKTRYLGRLTVDVAGDTISSFDSELIPTWVDSVKSPHPELNTLVKTFKAQIDTEYGKQIGTLKTAWKNSNFYETNLGNFLTDVMREPTGTDFALLNSGGIRKSLPAGPITKMDILEILPFSNYMTTFDCKGAVLFELLKNDIEGSQKNGYGLFQISGVDYAFKVNPDTTVTILSMTLGGRPIDPEKTYTGTTVDFVMSSLAERFDVSNVQTSSEFIADVVMAYIEKNPVVESFVEGRIRKVK